MSKPGDGFQFVERTASMTEAATRDHRQPPQAATIGPNISEVTSPIATSGMFINNRAIQMQAFPVENGS